MKNANKYPYWKLYPSNYLRLEVHETEMFYGGVWARLPQFIINFLCERQLKSYIKKTKEQDMSLKAHDVNNYLGLNNE